ncbi:MAG: CAP domain-containing protein [Patescibacteria group bacterium]|nr:CAP domain-containing protein [Patescibacteria group bacterium]
MINSYREDYKYSPLEISPTLERLAMDYCKKILRTGVINPDSASLDGGLTERIKASGYKGTYQYQVAMQRNDGFSLSYVLSQLFEDSEVLRSSDYQHIGIGYITASQKPPTSLFLVGAVQAKKKIHHKI